MSSHRALALALSLCACHGSDTGSDTAPVSTPEIGLRDPAPDATDVVVSVAPSITFSEPMAGVAADAAELLRDGIPVEVDAAWDTDRTVLTLDPTLDLRYQQTYDVVVHGDTESALGVPLGSDDSWSFTTGLPPAATVLSTLPLQNATAVRPDTTIRVVYSAEIAPGSVDGAVSVIEADTANIVYGTATADVNAVTFTPSGVLRPSTRYIATFGTELTDTHGTHVAAAVELSFTTVEPLTVVGMSPGNGATRISIEAPLVLTFSADLDTSSIADDSVMPYPNRRVENAFGPPATGTVTVSGNQLTFVPTGGLWQEYETTYDVRFDYSAVRGTGGQPLGYQNLDFTTIFVDPSYVYALHTEGNGRGSDLDTFAGSYQAHMSGGGTSGSHWFFDAFNSDWVLRNQYQPTLALAGKLNDAPALLETFGSYGNQIWHFDPYGGHGSGFVQGRGESPSVYRLETGQFADTLVLRTDWDSTQGRYLASLKGPTGSIYELWWLERLGHR